MTRNANEVRTVSDLPRWFDIEMYADARNLNSAGWYDNLSIRSFLLRKIGTESFERALREGSEIANVIVSDLAFLRSAPIFGWSGTKERSLNLLRGDNRRIIPQMGIQPMTVYDLYCAEQGIDEDKQAYVRTLFAKSDDSESFHDALCLTEESKEWHQNPLEDLLSDSLLKIDFRLPEDVLVEQFRALIMERQNSRKMVRRPDFRPWIKFGVLPYLDLKIWEQETRQVVINRVMADVIFEDGEGGEEAVRKSTRKYSKLVLRQECLDMLASLGESEIAEQNLA